MSKQGFSSPRRHYRSRQHALAALTLGLGTLAGTTVLAQPEQRLMVDVGPCVNIQSTLERFECYESRVDAARNDGDSVATTPAQRESSETVIPTPRAQQTQQSTQQPSQQAGTSSRNRSVIDESSFGLPEPREQQREAKQQELRSTITALRETVPNSYLITLENNQVWRQMRPERYRIQVGHDVRIYPSPFGSSFRLSADELRGFIQVERVE